MVTISYTKKHLNKFLYVGIVLLALLTLNVAWDIALGNYPNHRPFFNVGGPIFLMLFSLGTYFYKKTHPYIIIDSEKIIRNTLWSKTIAISDITSVKKYSKGYVVYSGTKKLGIETTIIDEASRKALINYFIRLAKEKGLTIPGIPVH